jgi:hypothetical protein
MRSTIEGMEEALWSMSQQSRVLQELRRDTRTVWDDEAARELSGRYFDPHEQDEQKMTLALRDQHASLEQCGLQLEASGEHGSKAAGHTAQVAEWLGHTQRDLDSSYGIYDLFVRYNNDARSKLPGIQSLLDSANSAGAAS